MKLADIEIDPSRLLSKQELIDFLTEDGPHDRSLSHIRERYFDEFGNELMWRYPISDGLHAGAFIVAVREGFASLPFAEMDKEDYEWIEMDHITLHDEDSIGYFIDDWKLFSDDLLAAMVDIRKILIENRID